MEQELGSGWAEGVHSEDLERCLETYIQAFDSRQEFEMQYRLRRRDGQYRWITDKGIPLFDSGGVFGGYIGSCTDITDSKHAVEALRVAEEQLRLVTDNMQAAVTQCSRDMRYVWVSPVYAQWLRRNPEEFRRKPIKDIVGSEGYEALLPHIERVLSGKKEEYEEEVHFADIGRRWIHAVYMPTKDESGIVNGWVAVVTDTTSKKQMEHERDQLLAREHQARSRAEEANQIKDEFLATISHELRTPLSAILGWTALLRDGILDQSKARQALEIIERNAKTQAQLIEDLLDVSRIVTGKLRLDVRPVMLASVIESAVSAVKPMAEAKDIRLQSTLDSNAGPVFGDAGRLQQVVWNLVNNAIKFTPRGGRVQIRLERINSHLEIAVSDTGIGIPIEFLPQVFDRFRQADSGTTRQHGGLGLGLAIVRQLVELHGGRVSAESAGEGQGSTFRVRLPLMVVHPRQTDEEPVHPKVETEKPLAFSSAPRLGGVRVLIIDDEADTRQLLRTVLEKCGAEVRVAGSSEQGLKEARNWKPSIVASDIGMPGHDGYHFIQTFREWERESGSWTPAVALTAYARAEDRVRALAAGYQIHVAKPIDPLEFALIIASQLGRGF
jgi:PAS domain S-box-containing protein